jgi:hypothetical protein
LNFLNTIFNTIFFNCKYNSIFFSAQPASRRRCQRDGASPEDQDQAFDGPPTPFGLTQKKLEFGHFLLEKKS